MGRFGGEVSWKEGGHVADEGLKGEHLVNVSKVDRCTSRSRRWIFRAKMLMRGDDTYMKHMATLENTSTSAYTKSAISSEHHEVKPQAKR